MTRAQRLDAVVRRAFRETYGNNDEAITEHGRVMLRSGHLTNGEMEGFRAAWRANGPRVVPEGWMVL